MCVGLLAALVTYTGTLIPGRFDHSCPLDGVSCGGTTTTGGVGSGGEGLGGGVRGKPAAIDDGVGGGGEALDGGEDGGKVVDGI